jgi:hypothetical protein
MDKSELEMFMDCITDWRWWLDGLAFMFFMAVLFAYYIIFAA